MDEGKLKKGKNLGSAANISTKILCDRKQASSKGYIYTFLHPPHIEAFSRPGYTAYKPLFLDTLLVYLALLPSCSCRSAAFLRNVTVQVLLVL